MRLKVLEKYCDFDGELHDLVAASCENVRGRVASLCDDNRRRTRAEESRLFECNLDLDSLAHTCRKCDQNVRHRGGNNRPCPHYTGARAAIHSDKPGGSDFDRPKAANHPLEADPRRNHGEGGGNETNVGHNRDQNGWDTGGSIRIGWNGIPQVPGWSSVIPGRKASAAEGFECSRKTVRLGLQNNVKMSS